MIDNEKIKAGTINGHWFISQQQGSEREAVSLWGKKGEEDYQKCAVMPYLDVLNGVMNHSLWFIIILVYNNG